MTCKICGNKLPEGSTVCKYCGARVKSAGGKNRRYSKKGLARRRVMNLLLALAALLVILAVVWGIAWTAGKNAGKTEAETEEALQERELPETPAEAPEKTGEKPAEKTEEKTEEKPEEKTEEKPEEQPEEKAEEKTEEQPEEKPEEKPEEQPAPEQPKEEAPAQTTYALELSREETAVTLRHYREVRTYFEPDLEGVTVTNVEWSVSDGSVIHTELVDGLCRVWGDALGEATLTAEVTLSNGQTLTDSCAVSVVETQIVSRNGYILPEANSRLYTEKELKSLTAEQLCYARNELFARHGYIFKEQDMKDYFGKQDWYKGTTSDANAAAAKFNSYEKANLETIKKVEKSKK